MKKKICLLIILSFCLAFFIFGCGKGKNIKNNGFDNLSKITLGEITESSDAQNYWLSLDHPLARCEGGYYFMSSGIGNNLLRYMDADTHEVYPVCSKPNCSHGRLEKECDALMDEYMENAVYYYNGLVYLLSNSGDLVSMSTDGSVKKKIGRVCSFNREMDMMGDMLVFYDKYVYAYDINQHIGMEEEYTETITKYDLNTGENLGDVVSYTGVGSGISNVRIYGNKMLFTITSLRSKGKSDNGRNTLDYQFEGLYVYDCDTSELGIVVDKPVTDYCVIADKNEIIYFVYKDGFYSLNTVDGTEKKLKENEENEQIIYMSYDGRYVYADNFRWYLAASWAGLPVERRCVYYDKDFSEIGRIDESKVGYYIFFGDESTMFYDTSDASQEYISMGYIDKQQEKWEYRNDIPGIN